MTGTRGCLSLLCAEETEALAALYKLFDSNSLRLQQACLLLYQDSSEAPGTWRMPHVPLFHVSVRGLSTTSYQWQLLPVQATRVPTTGLVPFP